MHLILLAVCIYIKIAPNAEETAWIFFVLKQRVIEKDGSLLRLGRGSALVPVGVTVVPKENASPRCQHGPAVWHHSRGVYYGFPPPLTFEEAAGA